MRFVPMLCALALAPAASAGGLELLSSGEAPRAELRFSPAKGSTQVVRLEVDVSMEMNMGGMAVPPMDVPTVFYELTAEVGDPTATTVPYTYTVSGAGALGEGMVADTMRKDFEALVGQTGVVEVSRLGRHLATGTSDTEASGVPDAQAVGQNLDETIAKLSIALPEQAVGVGARWRLVETVAEGALTVEQTSTWTLAETRPDGTFVVDVEVRQDAGKQEMPTANGSKAELQKMTSVTTGRTVVDPRKMLPVEVISSGVVEMVAHTDAMGQAMAMTSKIASKTRLTAK